MRPEEYDEAISFLEEMKKDLEEKLRIIELILEHLRNTRPPGRAPRPGERTTEIKIGRKRIASIYEGDGSVRVVPTTRIIAFPDAVEYLEEIVREIRAEQASTGEASAEHDVRTGDNGELIEAVVRGLRNGVEKAKARAALRHLVEVSWEYTRALTRRARKT